MTFGDTITWLKGRHTIKAGADAVYNAAKDGFTSGRGNPRGLINYSGAGTDPLARFLMGLPANTVSFVNQFRPRWMCTTGNRATSSRTTSRSTPPDPEPGPAV